MFPLVYYTTQMPQNLEKIPLLVMHDPHLTASIQGPPKRFGSFGGLLGKEEDQSPPWGNVCPARSQRATFLLTIPTSALDLSSHGEAPQVDHVALHTFPTKHVA